MKLSDYFDKIFIIGSLNSPNINHTIEKLKELGLYDENIYVQLYSPINDLRIIVDGINEEFFEYSNNKRYEMNNRISLALSHYTIIKHAYNAGLNNVLVLEDDNYFLNDISKWEEVLNNMPEDWDVMKFTGFVFHPSLNDLNICEKYINSKYRNINYNTDFNIKTTWSYGTSAVAYNRNAMEVYLKNQKKSFRLADHVSGVYDYNKVKTCKPLNIYMPMIPLFVPIDDIKKFKCCYYTKYNENDYI